MKMDDKKIESRVLDVFQRFPNQTFNYKQLLKRTDEKDVELKYSISKILSNLVKEKKIEEVGRGKFKLTKNEEIIIGKVDMTAKGAAYIVSEQREQDIFISRNHVKNVLNGDLVKARVLALKKGKPEGVIVEIIERAKTKFVGVLQVSQNFAFLIPDDRNMHVDIFIRGKIKKEWEGQKAIVEISKWSENDDNPEGKIVEILGDPRSNEVELHSIMAEYDLPVNFPNEVLQETNKLNLEIKENEIKNRRDFRNTTTFTIDPDDAKDFDDALSIKRLKNGNWEVGVHIADVSHYVQPQTALDKEAYKRATSVYLVGKVVPMLPEALSNQACSLRPDEEKYTFSAVFEMDEKAKVLNSWFGRTAIKSNRRFTYNQAQEIIETGKGDFSEDMLKLNQLAKELRAERLKKGAITFEKSEVQFELDKDGKPIRVFEKVMKDSNQLVEEFMLLANKKVAQFIGKIPKGSHKTPKTFLYRVHDLPDNEKLAQFSEFIARFGYKIDNKSPKSTALSIGKLLNEVKGKPEQNIIDQLAIRSMAKAIYTTNNIGHYGLGFEFYTHFTSPIRRYPDVIVHRLLAQYLKDGNSANQAQVEKQAKHCSEREKAATDAERSSIKFKQVEFLIDKVGEVYDGVVSGVTDFGIFVEIKENKCEGMIRLRDLKGDYFEFQEKNMCVWGRKTGRKIRLGDEFKIRIKNANLVKRQLDFELV